MKIFFSSLACIVICSLVLGCAASSSTQTTHGSNLPRTDALQPPLHKIDDFFAGWEKCTCVQTTTNFDWEGFHISSPNPNVNLMPIKCYYIDCDSNYLYVYLKFGSKIDSSYATNFSGYSLGSIYIGDNRFENITKYNPYKVGIVNLKNPKIRIEIGGGGYITHWRKGQFISYKLAEWEDGHGVFEDKCDYSSLMSPSFIVRDQEGVGLMVRRSDLRALNKCQWQIAYYPEYVPPEFVLWTPVSLSAMLR